MSENKIPCGGFYLGDGLAMEGDTLKSLGGAYVKVTTNDDFITFEFMDDSPLKTFEEIVQKMKTSPVTLLLHKNNIAAGTFFLDNISDISISFCALFVGEGNHLVATKISIDSDNNITFSTPRYTLTPAT